MNTLTKGKAKVGGVAVPAGEFDYGGTKVTATAAEINKLDGVSSGTVTASKAVVVGANKNVDVLAIADLKLGAGAGTSVTSTAAELNTLDGITSTTTELNLLHGTDRIVRVAEVDLSAVDTAGGLFAWSPGAAAIVKGLFLDVTTKATAACTVDCGVAANGTTSNDTLIDGLDVNAATGLFSNIIDHGTNGLAHVRCGATQYVTGSVATGASAGIVGKAYIEYILL